MFEEQYRKLYQNITPPKSLNNETIALMAEARNHRAKPLPAPKSKLPMILWLSIGGTLLVALIAAVAILAWLNRGARIDETLGVLDPNTLATEQEPAPAPDVDQPASKPEALPQESEPQTQADAAQPEIAIVPADQFETFDAYFKALDEKKTIGFGTQYYLAKELIVVPDGLPKDAEFLGISQYEDGQYSYSYLLKTENGSFLIAVQSQISLADTAKALDAQIALLKDEAKPTFLSEGNTRTYRFGAQDTVTVTVTREAETAPTDETEKAESQLPAEKADGSAINDLKFEEPTADQTASGESVEGFDPNESVSSPIQPAPLTQKEVDALLKGFTLSRYHE